MNNTDIFVNLRELNHILNNCDIIKQKPIKFIYAMKDDFFTEKERVKFFDFIIPVIPIISGSNSHEQFLELIQKSLNNHNISNSFLLDISPYITDMRMLKNIINEFITYKQVLTDKNQIQLIDEQLMSLIIFKNIYSNDFANLQFDKGIIAKQFAMKKEYVKNTKDEIQKDINNLQEQIEEIKKEYLQSIQELKAAMLMSLVDYKGMVTMLYSSNTISNEKIMQNDFDLNYFTNNYINGIEYIDYNEKEEYNIYDFNDIHIINDKIQEYVKRYNILNKKNRDGINKLEKKISKKQIELNNIENYNLKTLIEKSNNFSFIEELADKKLLILLLRKGYINENYTNYINYLYVNSITKLDMDFILSIKNQEPLEFNHHLTKIDEIIERLQDTEFKQREIYNFDLLEKLLSNKQQSRKLNIFIKQLTAHLINDNEKNSDTINFINKFIDYTNYKESFIKLLTNNWDGFWSYIVDNTTLTYDRQIVYLKLIISSLNESEIDKLNTNKSIKTYIEDYNIDTIIQLSKDVNIDKLCNILKHLNIKLQKQTLIDINPNLFKFIINNNLYDLNSIM